MGQNESIEAPREEIPPNTEGPVQSSHKVNISNEIFRKNFSKLEAYSLNSTFDNLLTIKEQGGIEEIEEETFIQYLGFPDEIETGKIIYRSFTYLASYPSPAHQKNPLTFDGLIKAIAIYCDKTNDIILEDRDKLIFESFAIHEELSDLGITPIKGVSYHPEDTNIESGSESDVSNAQEDEVSEVGSLKIKAINLDDEAAFFKALGLTQQKDNETYIVSKVPCNEMIEILSGIIWLMTNDLTPVSFKRDLTKDEPDSTSIDLIRMVVTSIVEHMARYDTELRNLPRSKIFSPETYIKWPIFKDFVQRNIPNVFNVFKTFFYTQFLIGQTLSQNRQSSMMIGPHVQLLPKLDETSECLRQIDLALFSWMLPEKVLNRKEWNLLYSGSKHGFSMNRFISHVFKYTGPTLFLIKAEITKNHRENSYRASPLEEKYSKKKLLSIGVYVTDQWRSTSSSRTCFGSAECCLFELHPTFESFPASHRNKNYVYFNPSFGIGFGGIATSGPASSKLGSTDSNSFVIQLDNTLQFGRYRNDSLQDSTPTYNLSVTRPFFDISFEVLDINVVGMGGEGIREKQRKDWLWEEKEAGKRQTHRKEVDKVILKMAGIIDENYRPDVQRKEP